MTRPRDSDDHPPAGDAAPPAGSAFTLIARHYDALMSGVPYSMWADYVEEIWDHLKVEPHRILDIATGTGSVALLLAERGYDVTGVDLSAAMIEQAQRRAGEEGLEIRFLQCDAAELDFPPQSFDAAICLYDSFNYITGPTRLQQAFDCAAAALPPGGSFIFDLNTVYSFEQELFTQESLSEDREVRYHWVSHYDARARITRVDMEFWTDDGGAFRETHYQRAYATRDITAMLEQSGFILDGVFEAYTFLPAGPRSERAFYVAVKG